MIKRKSVRSAFYFLTWVCFTFVFPVKGQVANNNINQRSELMPDGEWVHSNTANNSVEWRCVNKALTNKCLVYHNDQWFHFTPNRSGKFFLNISSQACRDKQGVQVIVIEGNPCEIKTYRILSCVPKIFLDDVFLELDSLKANTQYLVNVDGFLGDFCEFDIQVSSKPNGFPHFSQAVDTADFMLNLNKKIVHLRWKVNQTQAEALQHVEIFVKIEGDAKSKQKGKIQLQRNALGKFVEEYSMVDTLSRAGNYAYQIIGVLQDGMRIALGNKKITFIPEIVRPKEINTAIAVSFSYPGRVEVSIFNSLDRELLSYSIYEYQKVEMLSVNLTKFVERGLRQFQIKLRHNKSKESRTYDLYLNENGDIVQLKN